MGNVTMQIWLGKQRLGQKDKHDVTSADQALCGGMPMVDALAIMKSAVEHLEQTEEEK